GLLFLAPVPEGGDAAFQLWMRNVDPPTGWLRVPSSPGPEKRTSSTMAWDTAGDRLIVHGGRAVSGASLHDTWALTLDPTPSWTEVQTSTGAPPLGDYLS